MLISCDMDCSLFYVSGCEYCIHHSVKASWVGVWYNVGHDVLFCSISLISSLSMSLSLFLMPFIVLLLLFAIIDDKSW